MECACPLALCLSPSPFKRSQMVLSPQATHSGRGLPHSKTLARYPARSRMAEGFGVRLSSGAFGDYGSHRPLSKRQGTAALQNLAALRTALLIRQVQVAVMMPILETTAALAPSPRRTHRSSPAPRSCRRRAARSRGRGWPPSNPPPTRAPGPLAGSRRVTLTRDKVRGGQHQLGLEEDRLEPEGRVGNDVGLLQGTHTLRRMTLAVAAAAVGLVSLPNVRISAEPG